VISRGIAQEVVQVAPGGVPDSGGGGSCGIGSTLGSGVGSGVVCLPRSGGVTPVSLDLQLIC
jgi:hypothetical protein